MPPTSHGYLVESLRWFGVGLADHLWQSTIIALLALVAARLLRRAPARMRYAALLVGLLKFAFPVALLTRFKGVEQAFDYSAGKLGIHTPTSYFVLTHGVQPATYTTRLMEWGQFNAPAYLFEGAAGLWLGGSLLLFGLWWVRRLVFSARLKSDMTAGWKQGLIKAVEDFRARLKLRRKVRLIVTGEVDVPCVWGILRPVILLPPDLDRRLDRPEIEAVILHELVHVKRWDNAAGF